MKGLAKTKFSLGFISFLQATGLAVYCSLIGLVFINGNSWFGPQPTFLGPALFLVLFVVSALISAMMILGYPFILFWEKKQTLGALKLVVFSLLWLVFYFFLFLLMIVSLR